jgi:arsenite-transporting ATPase
VTRSLLFGGKGGVGKTTCAAATGLQLARDGHRTLVLSTDPAHSLADAFGGAVGSRPTSIRRNLWAVETDPETRVEQYRSMFADLAAEFESLGFRFADDEVEALFSAGISSGSDEIAALDAYLDAVESEEYDAVVLDTAPTGHTLRLLDLPAIVGDAMTSAMSVRGRVRQLSDSAKRLFLGPAYYMGGRSGTDADDLATFRDRLDRIARRLRDPDRTEFRVVALPERMVLAETERLIERLRAQDIPVSTVVLNRVVRDATPGCARCQAHQAEHAKIRDEVDATFPDLAVQVVPDVYPAVSGLAELENLTPRIEA